jgi:hypothetical protein
VIKSFSRVFVRWGEWVNDAEGLRKELGEITGGGDGDKAKRLPMTW